MRMASLSVSPSFSDSDRCRTCSLFMALGVSLSELETQIHSLELLRFFLKYKAGPERCRQVKQLVLKNGVTLIREGDILISGKEMKGKN